MATLARLVTVLEAQMVGFAKAQTTMEQTANSFQKSATQIDGSLKSIAGTAKTLAGAFGVAFSVQQVVAFAKNVSDFSGQMLDLSAETKVSTDRLQAFNYAGSDVGLTIEDIVGNMDQLAKRVGSGDKSAVGALEKLNINVENFKRLSLDDALFLIDTQAKSVGNQFDIAALRADLFGKAGQKMGRMMDGSLEQTIKAIEKTGSVIDRELLKKADTFWERWDHFFILFRARAVQTADFVANHWRSAFNFITLTKDVYGSLTAKTASDAPAWAQLGSFIGPQMNAATDTVAGGGLPEVAAGVSALDKAYAHLMSEIENERGLFLMNQDAALLNASLSETTRKLRELAMNIGPLGVLQSSSINPALLMGGPGAMPYGGNLYTYGSGVPLLGQGGGSFMGNLFGSFKSIFTGMTGGKGLGGLLSNLGSGFITGGLSSALGLATKGISALVGKLFGGEGKKTNNLRDSLFGQMGGLDKVAQMAANAGFAMDRLLKPSKVKDFQHAWDEFTQSVSKYQEHLETINQLTDAHAQRQQMLNDALARYNFSATEKGPLINMQEMAAQAEQLLTDYQLLSEAGVDHTAVLREMAGSVSDFVNRAIKTGTEVPEAMRAMIEEMIKNQQLLDENGNAFQSLEQTGIKFGESLTDMFKGVLQKLDELIAKLDASAKGFYEVGRAANTIPNSVIDPSKFSGGWEETPVPMASGGMGTVTRPTLFLAGEAGPEQFAFSGAGRSFGGGDRASLHAAIKEQTKTLKRLMETERILFRDMLQKAII